MLRDYLKLKKFTRRPWPIIRARRHHRRGEVTSVPLRSGPTLNLRGGTQDHSVFREIFVSDVYHIRKLPSRLGVVVDLGANVGLFSVRIAPMSERVIACEPVEANFDALVQNAKGLSNVVARPIAIAGTPGVLRLHSTTTDRGTGQFSSQPQTGLHDATCVIEVPALTLEQLFAEEKIDRCGLLKIDVEGAEYEILSAASDSSLRRIDQLAGEFHPSSADVGAADKMFDRLRRLSFDVRVEPQAGKTGYGMFFASRQP